MIRIDNIKNSKRGEKNLDLSGQSAHMILTVKKVAMRILHMILRTGILTGMK